MPLIEFTVDLGDEGEFDMIIEYNYTPEQRGRYSGPPESCYPDESEELEVTDVSFGGTDYTDQLSSKLEKDESFCNAVRDEYHDMLAGEV